MEGGSKRADKYCIFYFDSELILILSLHMYDYGYLSYIDSLKFFFHYKKLLCLTVNLVFHREK